MCFLLYYKSNISISACNSHSFTLFSILLTLHDEKGKLGKHEIFLVICHKIDFRC